MPTRPVLVEGHRADLYREIEAERVRQLALGYDARHDSRHTAADWICLLVRHVGLIPDDGLGVKDLQRAADQLVRVAALALANLERLAVAGVTPGGEVVPLPEEEYRDDKPVPVLPPEGRSRLH